MDKKNTTETKKDEKKILKIKIEEAKDGFDVKIGDMKLDADGVTTPMGNKAARTYYFKNKKNHARAYVVINDKVKAKGSSLDFKKVMEAVERSTQENMFQQFLHKIVTSLSVYSFIPVFIVIDIYDCGFIVGVNTDFTYSCPKLFWSDEEKDAAVIDQRRVSNE